VPGVRRRRLRLQRGLGAGDRRRPAAVLERGRLPNFLGFFEEGEQLLRASYGERNYERLVALENQYDPDNLFGGTGLIRATV
jgi:Berberine and berberine like